MVAARSATFKAGQGSGEHLSNHRLRGLPGPAVPLTAGSWLSVPSGLCQDSSASPASHSNLPASGLAGQVTYPHRLRFCTGSQRPRGRKLKNARRESAWHGALHEGEAGLAVDSSPGNSPARPGRLAADWLSPKWGTGRSRRRATPRFPNSRRVHAPGHWAPRTPEAGRSGSGSSVRKGSPPLTPPRSPGRVSGTSRPPRRALPGAGCRRPALLPPRGPSLPIALRSHHSHTPSPRAASPPPLLCAPLQPSQPRLLVPAGANHGAGARAFRAKPAQ